MLQHSLDNSIKIHARWRKNSPFPQKNVSSKHMIVKISDTMSHDAEDKQDKNPLSVLSADSMRTRNGVCI